MSKSASPTKYLLSLQDRKFKLLNYGTEAQIREGYCCRAAVSEVLACVLSNLICVTPYIKLVRPRDIKGAIGSAKTRLLWHRSRKEVNILYSMYIGTYIRSISFSFARVPVEWSSSSSVSRRDDDDDGSQNRHLERRRSRILIVLFWRREKMHLMKFTRNNLRRRCQTASSVLSVAGCI